MSMRDRIIAQARKQLGGGSRLNTSSLNGVSERELYSYFNEYVETVVEDSQSTSAKRGHGRREKGEWDDREW